MTRSTATLTLAIALAASLLLGAVGGHRLRAAAGRARAAEAQLAQVRADAGRVLTLRTRAQTVAAGEQPRQDVFRRVNWVLATAGLDRVRAQSVSPGGDQALDGDASGGPARRVQTVRIVLEPISLDELGAFLARWRNDQALWTVTGVDLAAANARDGGYRAALTAAAVYVPASPATAPPNSPPSTTP